MSKVKDLLKRHKAYRSRLQEYLYFARHAKKDNFPVNLSGGKIFGDIEIEERKDGKHPFECMFSFDSQGKLPPTKSKEMLHWLLIGKSHRDWHITEWAGGFCEGILTPAELLDDKVLASLVESALKAAVSKGYPTCAHRARLLLCRTHAARSSSF